LHKKKFIIFFADQVVFAGDSLKLRCRAPTAGTTVGERSIANVVWMWGSQDPAEVFEEIRVENRYIADSGLVERYVILSKALHFYLIGMISVPCLPHRC
jgi:hypothetical protein